LEEQLQLFHPKEIARGSTIESTIVITGWVTEYATVAASRFIFIAIHQVKESLFCWHSYYLTKRTPECKTKHKSLEHD
jgi:hypothetical protein